MEISDNLKSFLKNDRWVFIDDELHLNTKLEEELNITGDDAVEFIVEFGKQFEVDVSHFVIDEYFEPEGFNLISSFIDRLFKNKKRNRKSLTLGDLEKAIETKELR